MLVSCDAEADVDVDVDVDDIVQVAVERSEVRRETAGAVARRYVRKLFIMPCMRREK